MVRNPIDTLYFDLLPLESTLRLRYFISITLLANFDRGCSISGNFDDDIYNDLARHLASKFAIGVRLEEGIEKG
jgi:hypothetical protein